MRPPGFPPAKRRPIAKRALFGGRASGSAARSTAAFLGTEHPLVQALDDLDTVAMQSRVVLAIVCASIVARMAGVHRAGTLTLSGAIVLAALALIGVALRQSVREQTVKLILAGHDDLPIPAVQAQRRRLLAPRNRYALARSLDAMVGRALNPPSVPTRGVRPIFDVVVVAAASRELRAVAALLREPCESVIGVALAEQLLTQPDSPLYGHDVGLLRDDLGRLQSHLRASAGTPM
jgi:hypothetical protein